MSRIRQGGGFGFVMLLVVLAVILYLASRSSTKLLPQLPSGAAAVGTESEAPAPSGPPAPPAATNSGAGQAPIQSRLSDAKAKTAAHSAQVQDALGEQ